MTKQSYPMRHTVTMGIACAILATLLIPMGIGFGVGYLVGEHNHPHRVTSR